MFYKQYTNTSGIITSYHKVNSIVATFPTSSGIVTLNCYTSKASILLGEAPLYTVLVSVPFSAIGPNVTRSIENWIVSDPSNAFYGGDLQPDVSSDPLVAAKDKQWEIIKAKRAALVMAVDIDQSQAAIDLAIKNIRDTALSLKAQIVAATTIEEVQAIIWP